MKTVSIVLCTYNGGKYLAQQLDTILQQSYPLFEIIVQDDGSTDDTIDIVLSYKEKYPIITLIQNVHNLGPNINFLTGIERAKGDYIALSDQDDVWDPTKIAELVHTMEQTGKAVGFCRSREFSEDGSIEVFSDERTPNYSMERMIFGDSMAPGHTMIIRRSFVPELSVEKYRALDSGGHDEFIALMAAANESLCLCNKVLVRYRRHSTQASAGRDRSFTFRNNWFSIGVVALKSYRRKKNVMEEFFTKRLQFFSALPIHNPSLNNALRLAYLFSHRSLVNYFRLTALCVRLRRKIFFTAEMPPLKLLVRSFFFPLYCATYFKD